MENNGQSKIVKIFWRFFSPIVTVCLVGVMFKSMWTKDPKTNSGLLIFVPVVAMILFPFFTVLSYGIQLHLKAKQLHISNTQCTSDGRLKSLIERGSLWVNITFATWIIIFLSILAIPITLRITDKTDRGIQLVNVGQPQILSQGSNTHNLLYIFDTIIHYLFLIPIIALILGAVILIRSLFGKWWKSDRKMSSGWKKAGYAAMIAFILPIIITSVLSFTVKKIVRHEVKVWLENVSNNAIVSVNNEEVQKPRTIIDGLKKLTVLPAHHSRVTKRIRIAIRDGDQGLVIDLGRDSDRHEEYWVFYLGYRHTCVNEIGRITTTLFENF